MQVGSTEFDGYWLIIGSGAYHSKMLLIRIIENNKIDVYFTSG